MAFFKGFDRIPPWETLFGFFTPTVRLLFWTLSTRVQMGSQFMATHFTVQTRGSRLVTDATTSQHHRWFTNIISNVPLQGILSRATPCAPERISPKFLTSKTLQTGSR